MIWQPANLDEWFAGERQPATDLFGDVDARTYARTQLVVAAMAIEYGLGIGVEPEVAKKVASVVIDLASSYEVLCSYIDADLSALFEQVNEGGRRAQYLAPVADLSEARRSKRKAKLSAPRQRRNLKELPYLLEKTCESLEEEVGLLLPQINEQDRILCIDSIGKELEEVCRQLTAQQIKLTASLLDAAARRAVVVQKLYNYISQTSHVKEELAKLRQAMGVFLHLCKPYIGAIVYRAERTEDVSQVDLEQEAVIGFMQALGRYDLSQTSLVMTYCSKRIHGSVIDAIRSHNRSTRSRGDVQLYKKYLDMKDRGMDSEQMAAELGMTKEGFAKKIGRVRNSGTRRLEGSGAESIAATIPTPEEESEKEANIEMVHELLKRVSPKDADFIAMRFGLYPYDRTHTLQEIGVSRGYTEGRASQKLSEIMATLRTRIEPLL